MEQNSQTCTICGCTQSNLVNGFYYCMECGTQDTTVRETVVDNVLADGTVQLFQKKKITKKKPKVHISAEWRNWHIYNYVLHGLTNELITLGAKPSLKGKVLWLWSKYINKYQNKAQFHKYTRSSNHILEENSDDENKDEGNQSKQDELNLVTMKIMFTILYAALNLDGSHITPSFVRRFLKEGRMCYRNYNKFVPIRLSLGEIQTLRSGTSMPTISPLLIGCSKLFKVLDLGSPLIPDLKALITVYVKELCLPNEFRDLVYSLIDFMPFDIAVEAVRNRVWQGFPHFEVIVMCYVIIALKMCFGLDDHYDLELSARVDSLNAEHGHPKRYRMGCSQSATRLFSFKEWVEYLDFRKYVLCKYYQPFATQFRIVNDDCVITEMVKDRKVKTGVKYSENAVTFDLINKIPNDTFSFLDKSDFPNSLTPLSTYTAHIASRIDDQATSLRLSEDFTKYSMKYACVDLSLDGKKKIDNNGEVQTVNMVRGPGAETKILNKRLTKSIFSDLFFWSGVDSDYRNKIIYVKNTNYRDWYLEYKKANYVETGEFDDSDEEILQCLESSKNKMKTIRNVRKEYFVPDLRIVHTNSKDSEPPSEEQRLLEALKMNPSQISNYYEATKKTADKRTLLLRKKFMARSREQKISMDLEEKRLLEALRIKPKLLPIYYESYEASKTSVSHDFHEDGSNKCSKPVKNVSRKHNHRDTCPSSPPPHSSHAIEREINNEKQRIQALQAKRARQKRLNDHENLMNKRNQLFKPVKLELKEIADLNVGQNIFDDEFEPFEEQLNATKVENEFTDDYHVFDFTQSHYDSEFEEKPLNDVQCRDSVDLEDLKTRFEPFTFDRDKVIKELILKACAKYKIPMPAEYKARKPPKNKKMITPRNRQKIDDSAIPLVKSDDVIRSYFDCLQNFSDKLHKTIDDTLCAERNDGTLNFFDQPNLDTSVLDDFNESKDITAINDAISLVNETDVVCDDPTEPETDIQNDVELQKIIAKTKAILDSETVKSEILSKLGSAAAKKDARKIADIRLVEEPSEPLIKKFPESFSFHYATKHYPHEMHLASYGCHLRFREEMLANFPKSLAYVIETCSALIETDPYHLYRHLQFMEKQFLEISGWAEEVHQDPVVETKDVDDNRMDVDQSLAQEAVDVSPADQDEDPSRVDSNDDVCEVFIVIDDSDGETHTV